MSDKLTKRLAAIEARIDESFERTPAAPVSDEEARNFYDMLGAGTAVAVTVFE